MLNRWQLILPTALPNLMTQNTSHAVMQQRSESHDSLDDFPTPPWATRAFCEYLLKGEIIGTDTVWEPACNRGYMAKPLSEYFNTVHTSDIHDYGWKGQHRVTDFLFPHSEPEDKIDWIITNPPFRLAEDFIFRGLEVARKGIAVIVRTSFMEGVRRYNGIFKDSPPTYVAQYAERVPMHKARYDPNGTTATSYAWFVWKKGCDSNCQLKWIPPCKKRLMRSTDGE